MEFLFVIFYACLRLWLLAAQTNPGPLRSIPDVCKILCSNVRGLAGNLSDLTVVSSRYNILLCSETGLGYASRVGVADSRIRAPCVVVKGQDASGPWDGCIRSRWLRKISPIQI